MVVCNVAWQGDSTALPFSFSFFIARSSTVCGTQHQLLHVPRLLPKPNSPTLTLLLTPFVKISTPHNHHSSLTSAAEASPQSYYWGEGFAKSVLRHQLHLLPRTRATPASPDHFKQNNQTKSSTNLIYAISATDASSSPDASFDRTREPKRTYKILRLLRPSNRVCTLPDTRSPPSYTVFCVDMHFVSYVGHWF